MKRIIFLLLLLCIAINIANAQNDLLWEKFEAEITPYTNVINEIESKVVGPDYVRPSLYGLKEARQVVAHSLKVCEIIDKYINQFNDPADKMDLLWGKVDMLDAVIGDYDRILKNEISQTEKEIQVNRRIATLKQMLSLSEKDNTAITYIGNELGHVYFKQEKYKEAQTYYSMSVSSYDKITSNEMDQYNSEQRKSLTSTARESNYYLGYTYYKLGQTAQAQIYYDKAKSIKGDEILNRPYK